MITEKTIVKTEGKALVGESTYHYEKYIEDSVSEWGGVEVELWEAESAIIKIGNTLIYVEIVECCNEHDEQDTIFSHAEIVIPDTRNPKQLNDLRGNERWIL